MRIPLLKRLCAESSWGQGMLGTEEDLVAEIGHSLTALFNTHQGSSGLQADYGLPDFNTVNHSHLNWVRSVESEMLSLIAKYEPRLKIHSVKGELSPEIPDKVRFTLQGQLRHTPKALPVLYHSWITREGQVYVKR